MGLLDAQSVYRAYRAWRTAASRHEYFCDGVLLLASCRPTHGDRRRTHPFDPLPTVAKDRFGEIQYCGHFAPAHADHAGTVTGALQGSTDTRSRPADSLHNTARG